MRSRWFERWARRLVAAMGFSLLGWGLAAMWQGWDTIQVERGWSLFIGGAAALAGGSVTLALCLVVARLDRLLDIQGGRNASPPARAEAEAPASASQARLSRPREPEPELREVDRFVSGDVTYVMFSDGSVEVRSFSGVRRFSSLAELKAQAGERG